MKFKDLIGECRFQLSESRIIADDADDADFKSFFSVVL